MKTVFKISVLLFAQTLTTWAYGQTTPNRMNVTVDNHVYKCEPRKIQYGQVVWITGNAISPDKTLRVAIGNWASPGAYIPGKYLICATDKDVPKDQIDKLATDNFVGVAFMLYVEETKAPRMQYHEGKSQNNNEILMVSVVNDSTILQFDKATLAGTHWKEKVTTTVFGGVGRLEQKVIDKGKTKATGYDDDIEPEHNGYKKETNTDAILLTSGRISLYTK
jgi:hypothetical protein